MNKIPNIQDLNKAFENRVRLGIMSILMVNDSVDFNRMKELLNVTDGNLASHVSALEKEGFIHVKKEFVGKKPLTTYSVTKIGMKAFEDHLNALEKLIRMNQ
ncbi:MAG: Transcriptional regulator ArsR family [Crocinitomicaceae bacterium]|jgi:DNA-binding MarR family transcriptional regulator|nr:Transcriptional regulator ArsR family [Crocinitomicaceae bacterium]